MLENIERTKAMLQRMGPDQLRQFAAAHMDDMIAMSLVSSVQAERNKTKVQQQAQQANAAPPKVNQQVIQSLQAEDSGIAALPADNITYADGGIVGYSGADEEQLVIDPTGAISNASGVVEKPNLSWPSSNQIWEALGLMSPANRKSREELEDYERRRREGKLTNEEKQKLGMSVDLPRVSYPGYSLASSISPELEAQLRQDFIASGGDPSKFRINLETKGGVQATPEQFGLTSRRSSGNQAAYAPSAPAALSDASLAAPPVDSAVPAAPAISLDELFKQAQTAAGVGKEVDPYAAERARNAEIIKAQNEAKLADAQARQAGLQGILKPKEERLAAREAALEKQAEMDKSMALITAGLSMMQTSGLGGLAAGAAKGFEQYGKSMQLSKAERQKIEDARDAYDEFKYNAENMSQKEVTAARGEIAAGAVAASNATIQALMDEYKLKRADAAALFKAMADAKLRQQQDDAAMARVREETKGRLQVPTTTSEYMAIQDLMNQHKISFSDAYAKVKQIASGFKGEMTRDQATDNVKAFLESAQGAMYVREIQNKAKNAGQPIPDIYTIRNGLIEQEMGGSARSQSSVPPPGAVREKIRN